MTLANGRKLLSIPGPTTIPDEVLTAMHHPAVDIYGGPLQEVTFSCIADLKRVFRTAGDTYMYAANGHGAWEAALTNVLSRGDTVLVLQSGLFATVWGENARGLGLNVETVAERPGRAVDADAVEARLRADRAGAIKAVLMVQIDTATGVHNDVAAVRRAMDAAGHDALLMVDTIASLGSVPYDMDAWRVDVTVGGAQKGLMTPPGLSFNAVGPKAKQARERADLVTGYWDWKFRDGDEHYMKFAGTPPEQLVLALRQALDMIFAEGFEAIFRRHAVLAEATRRAVAAWAGAGAMRFAVTEPAERSNSVTAVLMERDGSALALIEHCAKTYGVTVGRGIGPLTGKAIRIAHMGHVNAVAQLGTLAAVEAGLAALGIPHGAGGTQAAIDHIARETAP